MKQETIKETAEKMSLNDNKFNMFISVAKWQAEQNKNKYSEEEMLDFAWFLVKNIGQYSCDEIAHFEGKYLEQFKKKVR